VRIADALARADAMLATQDALAEWVVVIDRRPKKRMGQTRYTPREIGLTQAYVELNDWPIIEAVMLHEMAHALVGPGKGHGAEWKAQARALGLRNPRAAASTEGLVCPPRPGGVVIICPRHGELGTRTRMPAGRARYRHNGCGEVVIFSRKSAQVVAEGSR